MPTWYRKFAFGAIIVGLVGAGIITLFIPNEELQSLLFGLVPLPLAFTMQPLYLRTEPYHPNLSRLTRSAGLLAIFQLVLTIIIGFAQQIIQTPRELTGQLILPMSYGILTTLTVIITISSCGLLALWALSNGLMGIKTKTLPIITALLGIVVGISVLVLPPMVIFTDWLAFLDDSEYLGTVMFTVWAICALGWMSGLSATMLIPPSAKKALSS